MLRKMEESGVTGPLPKSEVLRLKAECLLNLSDDRVKGEALDLLIRSIADAEATPVSKIKSLTSVVQLYYVILKVLRKIDSKDRVGITEHSTEYVKELGSLCVYMKTVNKGVPIFVKNAETLVHLFIK
jgi:hypothetical protein